MYVQSGSTTEKVNSPPPSHSIARRLIAHNNNNSNKKETRSHQPIRTVFSLPLSSQTNPDIGGRLTGLDGKL